MYDIQPIIQHALRFRQHAIDIQQCSYRSSNNNNYNNNSNSNSNSYSNSNSIHLQAINSSRSIPHLSDSYRGDTSFSLLSKVTIHLLLLFVLDIDRSYSVPSLLLCSNMDFFISIIFLLLLLLLIIIRDSNIPARYMKK